MNRFKMYVVAFGLILASTTLTFAQQINPIEGRWDMVISQEGEELPSWLEIRHSGSRTLVGRFVYAMGSARPISEVKMKDGKFSFAIPPQWEDGNTYMEFEGSMNGDVLKGTMLYTNGQTYNWVATRAPQLEYTKNPKWGKPIKLFNGKDLSGWQAMGENQWIAESGVLKSPKSGSNLVSDQKFNDFKLHLEFKYPQGSNSGVYLRGRYEVQIMDSKGAEPSDVEYSGVYGFLTPSEVAAKAAGEWQEYDITLIGRRVTVVANGTTVISDQIIPGITGGALDSKEGEPGPLYFQGDHGPIEFRNIIVTPRVD
ncbi:3-keto-disaccharide hydrolase [Arenibacter algicola]|uniref:Large multifunctional protein-glycosyl hydrolase n=1 Tax=Arenibacter algicola TaxID=616991 RepID=A0A221UU25_9FLAO|nr:DUF1080 domain-containing protein [Arenibacter algicola]ASO04391.1 large multifunctional protein- glycosyl hydrolase [Arenibacter algicola]